MAPKQTPQVQGKKAATGLGVVEKKPPSGAKGPSNHIVKPGK